VSNTIEETEYAGCHLHGLAVKLCSKKVLRFLTGGAG